MKHEKQLTEESDLIGRIIADKKVVYLGGGAAGFALFFTDGTFAVIEATADEDEADIEIAGDLMPGRLREIGVITSEEYAAEMERLNDGFKRQETERRRLQYEALKREFEPEAARA